MFDCRSIVLNSPFSSVQFSSVAQSCLTLCDPMNRSTLGLPVHNQLPESIQIHVHWDSDAIQAFHPLSSPSPPALNLCQHPGLCKWVSSLHEVVKVLEFQLQHQSFQWTPRLISLRWTGWIYLQFKGLSTPEFKSINSRFLPCAGYYKQCCDEHWGTCVSFNFHFLSVYAQQWDCWVIRQLYFQFFKESSHCSP